MSTISARRSLFIAAMLASPALAGSPFGDASRIQYDDAQTVVTDINEGGDLSGYGRKTNGMGATTDYAFVYHADNKSFGFVSYGRAYGINDAGDVVGQADGDKAGAFVARPGVNVLYLGASHQMGMAHDINNNGIVVGRGGPQMDLASYDLQNDHFVVHGRPAGTFTYPQNWQDVRTSINDRNVAVTSLFKDTTAESQAAIRKPIAPPPHGGGDAYTSHFSYLGGPAGPSHATTINNAGLVGGSIDGNAAVWTNLGASTLHTALGDGDSMYRGTVRDLNNLGVAVGQSRFEGKSRDRGFIWRNGIATDLNTLIDVSHLGVDARIQDAVAINDRGQIVVSVFVSNFVSPQTYVYQPVEGSSIYTPRMPNATNQETGVHDFVDVAGGQWFDPISASGYTFEMRSAGSGFANILELPSGFGEMTVTVDGKTFTLDAGDALELDGAQSFAVTWDPQTFESIGSLAFPIKLDFTTATASFRMTPIFTEVPEPTTLGAVAGVAMLLRRRRRA